MCQVTHTHSRSGHCRNTLMIEKWPHSQESTNKTIRQVRLELRLVDWLVRFCKLNGSTLRCDYVTARIISITSHPMSACDHNDHSTTKQITQKTSYPKKQKFLLTSSAHHQFRYNLVTEKNAHHKWHTHNTVHTPNTKCFFFSHQHHHQQNNE